MGYTLRALVARCDLFAEPPAWTAHSAAIPLPQGFCMLPPSQALAYQFGPAERPWLYTAQPGFTHLPQALVPALLELSRHGRLAYVEAEYDGAGGEQRSLAWEGGAPAREREESPGAINAALRWLGVRPAGDDDAFDPGAGPPPERGRLAGGCTAAGGARPSGPGAGSRTASVVAQVALRRGGSRSSGSFLRLRPGLVEVDDAAVPEPEERQQNQQEQKGDHPPRPAPSAPARHVAVRRVRVPAGRRRGRGMGNAAVRTHARLGAHLCAAFAATGHRHSPPAFRNGGTSRPRARAWQETDRKGNRRRGVSSIPRRRLASSRRRGGGATVRIRTPGRSLADAPPAAAIRPPFDPPMSMKTILLRALPVVCAALLADPSALRAQSVSDVAPGTRVRVVEAGAGRIVGTVSEVRGDSLLLVSGRGESRKVVAVSVSSLRRLQVSRGRESRQAAALRGAGMGLLGGAVAGAAGATLGHLAGNSGCDGSPDEPLLQHRGVGALRRAVWRALWRGVGRRRRIRLSGGAVALRAPGRGARRVRERTRRRRTARARRHAAMIRTPGGRPADPAAMGAEPVPVRVWRESVAAGDDIDAPHERVFLVQPGESMAHFADRIARAGYLAQIWGGKATWIMESSGRPLALVAQQWSAARLLVPGDAPALHVIDRSGTPHVHLRYRAQDDPDAVCRALRDRPTTGTPDAR